MSNFDKIKNDVLSGGKASKIEQLAKSSEAARLGKIVNADELKKAAATGDQATLGKILQQVMSTDDGKALLKKVSESFGKK